MVFPFRFLFCGLILVLLIILPEYMGVMGVWLAVPIAELLTMVVALVFLYQKHYYQKIKAIPDGQNGWRGQKNKKHPRALTFSQRGHKLK